MSIRINVDPTNPGQFFACCGLLELADRMCPGAEAWFEDREFFVSCDKELASVFKILKKCKLTNTMTDDEHARFNELSALTVKERKKSPGLEVELKSLGKQIREAPIVLKETFNIVLDWFVDDLAGGSRFKTWAGQQSVLSIASSMHDALKSDFQADNSCLSFSANGIGLPFNFDSDLGSQGGAIDIGFSFDPLASSALTRIEPVARPVLELFAFIGLQRFRPHEFSGRNRFLYATWNKSLAIEVAAPAACGTFQFAGMRQFEFQLLYRTKYLKSFLPAIHSTGVSNE